MVVYHAADNSFPEWKEYNRITGLGGWGNRNEKSGPYVYYKGDEIVRDDTSKGIGGTHGARNEFLVKTRNSQHPIMKGLPANWMHGTDELYSLLRGPAENMEILATANSGNRGLNRPAVPTPAGAAAVGSTSRTRRRGCSWGLCWPGWCMCFCRPGGWRGRWASAAGEECSGRRLSEFRCRSAVAA